MRKGVLAPSAGRLLGVGFVVDDRVTGRGFEGKIHGVTRVPSNEPGPPSSGSASDGEVTEVGTGGGRVQSPSTDLPRGAAVDRYTVLSRLGAGGMGVVYLAYDPELDRRVAIKLLHRASQKEQQRSRMRLIREAQALARLAHPNVVSVYDVGEHEGEVWLAMERVEGQTLSQWCAAERPHWTELLRVLVDAGRGVAAAHAAGLVHRDLKPANVMVAGDGRVRVMDFGLARARQGEDASKPEGSEPEGADAKTSGEHEGRLTRTHDVMGTPAYMAPEQWDGARIDARADQFSWCMMAWEALYGRRPYGEQAMAVLTADRIGSVPRRPPSGRVPGWLRKLLERGLDRDPAARWDGMGALLDIIDRRRSRRRLQQVTGVLSALLVLGLIGYGIRTLERGRQTQACRDAGAEIEGLWPGRAEAVATALRASSALYVRRLEANLTPRLDQWAQDWRGIRTEACEAATVEQTMDDVQRARIELCLMGQRMGVSIVLDLLEQGDLGVLRKASFVATSVPALEECRDAEQLESIPISKFGHLHALQQGFEGWLRARALQDAGRYEDALDEAQQLRERAQERGWAPLVAQAGLLEGTLHRDLGRHREAANMLRRLYFEAGSSDENRVAASAAVDLVVVEGLELSRPEQGLAWVDHARMMMNRLEPPDPTQAIELLENEAWVHHAKGDRSKARSLFERVLEQRREALGGDHPEVALALRNLAMVRLGQGVFEDAVTLDRQALEILERVLGADHPEVAKTLLHLASAVRQHDRDEARALYRRSLEMMTRALGPEHPDLAAPMHALASMDDHKGLREQALRVHRRALSLRERRLPELHPKIAESLLALGMSLRRSGNDQQALALYERALKIVKQTVGLEHPRGAELLWQMGDVQHARGQLDESVRLFERALEISSRVHGGEHVEIARILNNLGSVVHDVGDLDRAQGLYSRARMMMQRVVGERSPLVGYPTAGLAEVALARGDAVAARRWAKEAIDLLSERNEPVATADCHFVLAQARWQLGEHDDSVLALARRAAAVYREHGPAHESSRHAVEAWLATREG